MSRYRFRLAKLARRLLPDTTRPQSIDVMALDGEQVFATVSCRDGSITWHCDTNPEATT